LIGLGKIARPAHREFRCRPEKFIDQDAASDLHGAMENQCAVTGKCAISGTWLSRIYTDDAARPEYA
jgi:hypothetical protein